jgi:hypothetical protein
LARRSRRADLLSRSDSPEVDMTSILPVGVARTARVAICLVVGFFSPRVAHACETLPDLHIEVTTKFDAAPVRSDYSLDAIAALARKSQRDVGRALLGFYASQFSYTINLAPAGDKACPARIDSTVTLRLTRRVIEIGQEATTNSCAYPVALQHYRRLAEADEQTIRRFGVRTAAALAQASDALKQNRAPQAPDLATALREQIRAVVDVAIAPLHDARQDAQQAMNNASELRQLASSCSI